MKSFGNLNPWCWIDIVCIDQNDANVAVELAKLPMIYAQADFHLIIGLNTFTRGWCQYEIAVNVSNCIAALILLRETLEKDYSIHCLMKQRKHSN